MILCALPTASSTRESSRTHDAAHELTRIGSGTTPATISYDTKGNITQNQRTPDCRVCAASRQPVPFSIPAPFSSRNTPIVWDFDNRLISADTNGDSTADVTYEYDALGRRVARTQGATAVVYIHAGQQTVCDYTRGANANTTPAFRYVWGDYIDEPILRQTGSSTLLYYHHNQQYSTVAITSASGLVVTRYGYTAYGDQTIMSHTGASQTYATYSLRHTYTGREWDDSLKANYFRARWYDAALGRFVNRDPIGYVDGLSLYRAYFGPSGSDFLGLFGVFFGGTDEGFPGMEPEDQPRTGFGDPAVPGNIARLQSEYADDGGSRFYFVAFNSNLPDNDEGTGVIQVAHRNICDYVCSRVGDDANCGVDQMFVVDLFGWSRGLVGVVVLADRLRMEGCQCGGIDITPLPIRFMGLLDAVRMQSLVDLPQSPNSQFVIPSNVLFAQHEHRDGTQDRRDLFARLWPLINFVREHPNPWALTHGEVGRNIEVGDHLQRVAIQHGVKFR
jgi:RHS repeat-associated protein